MLQLLSFFFTLSLLILGALSCASVNDPCNGFSCPQGLTCVDQAGTPTCVPAGPGNNSGTGQVGDECFTTADCAAPLTCQADLNGNLVCTSP